MNFFILLSSIDHAIEKREGPGHRQSTIYEPLPAYLLESVWPRVPSTDQPEVHVPLAVPNAHMAGMFEMMKAFMDQFGKTSASSCPVPDDHAKKLFFVPSMDSSLAAFCSLLALCSIIK